MNMYPYDSTKPAYQANRAASDVRNDMYAIHCGDVYALRPRAQASPNTTIHVNGTLVESFWLQTWNGLLAPLNFSGGDTSPVSAPSTNPRIDLLTIDSSGTLAWTQGVEAASPAAPNCPDGKIPICYIFCRTTMTKIVNFEDSGSYPSDAYIYMDVRPFLNMGGGSVVAATNFQTFDKLFAGDGSDGDAIISVNTTLTVGSGGIKVIRYNNLQVNYGIYLEGNASDQVLVILVKGTLTLNGTIRMYARGMAHNQSGAFGGGGGGDGYDGNAISGGGNSGLGWNVGGYNKGTLGAAGVGGSGGTGTNNVNLPRVPFPFELIRMLFGSGGGDGGTTSGAYNGIGGNGSGIIWIEANSIVWGGSGLMSANGVSGGNANTYGGAGGGGGGAGGTIQVCYKTKSGSSTFQVSPGVGGSPTTGGYPGGGGASGLTGEFQVQ